MAKKKAEMTFDNYRKFLLKLQKHGYEFWTHDDFASAPKQSEGSKVILLRHDVDLDSGMRATEQMARIETELGITSTVFLRLHDPMYSILGYRELSVIRDTIALYHEIGLHCETADVARAIGMGETDVLKMDLIVLRSVTGMLISGVAAHGDISGADNIGLMSSLKLEEFGLKYHAYQKGKKGPFSGWYISQCQGNEWKRYVDGILQEAGEFDFMQYVETMNQAGVQKCTFLIHPRPWCDVHYLSE